MIATSGAAGAWKRPKQARLGGRHVFLLIVLADVLACNALVSLGYQEAVWLINLPATLSVGRLVSMVSGDMLAMAVTVPVGAAVYGWTGSWLRDRSEGRLVKELVERG